MSRLFFLLTSFNNLTSSSDLCTSLPFQARKNNCSLFTSPLHMTMINFVNHWPHCLLQRLQPFSPPLCYHASSAVASSLLRAHLPPCMLSTAVLNCFLTSRPEKKKFQQRYKASPVTKRVPVKNATLNHISALTKYWASRYFARLPPLTCRIRFAFAVYS